MAGSDLIRERAIVFSTLDVFAGAERAAVALCEWLSAQQLPHRVVCFQDNCGLARYCATPLRVVELGRAEGGRAKVAALRRYFTGSSASVMKPLLSGYQPVLQATLSGLRGFHNLMHDTPSLFIPSRHEGVRDRLRLKLSNAIVGYGVRSGGQTIVTSEYLRDECWREFHVRAEIARMGGKRSEVVVPRRVDRTLRMLSVCRIEANKRIDWLLYALAALELGAVAPLERHLSQLTDWRLDLVGHGVLLEPLRELVHTLGLSERVTFHGFLSEQEMEAMYAQANLFLMPAVQGYGIPAVESLARGIPVLLHRESGVSDILQNTPWATVFHGGEETMTAALATAVARVLSGSYLDVSLPRIPTEAEWAERVATLCGWV